LGKPSLLSLSPNELLDLTLDKVVAKGVKADEGQQLIDQVREIILRKNKEAVDRFTRSDLDRIRFMGLLQKDTPSEPLIKWGEDEFYARFPKTWQNVDIFQQSFARLFADYQREWLNNVLKRVAATKGDAIKALTDEEFKKEHGDPPWEFVNQILTRAGLDFRINKPPEYEDRPYEAKLTDQITHSEVLFSDLSSGEKILMSFAFCLYYAQDRRQRVEYPKVLLFDEIDAPLHPSMTQSLLRTITEVLLERHKIKVLLTTHAPSTAALADEQGLYAMFKTRPRIRKATKDQVLSLLTAGVPTLSIDFENRRQVFVESLYDVRYYESVYEKLRGRLVPEISLTFIASGKEGKGNCDQVKEVVNQLHKGGSRSVYGIIDWDLKNVGNERVKVLGSDARYSIENYILDPLLIATLVVREKFVSAADLGLRNDETFLSIGAMSADRLQTIADSIIAKTKAYVVKGGADETLIECHYVNGASIKIPGWFLRTRGHQLEAALKQAYPQLGRYTKEPELKLAICSKAVDDVPNVLSQDFVAIFGAIQNYSSA
jgi:hypothetical protein